MCRIPAGHLIHEKAHVGLMHGKKNAPYVVFSKQHIVKVFVVEQSLIKLLSFSLYHISWIIRHKIISFLTNSAPGVWLPQHLTCRYSRFPVWAEGQGINLNCVLHYFQMSEAVRAIIWAFSPTFCHFSPILGPRGHVKIESDSQSSMLNRLIGLSCHGPDQSSLTPGLSEVLLLQLPDPKNRKETDTKKKIQA